MSGLLGGWGRLRLIAVLGSSVLANACALDDRDFAVSEPTGEMNALKPAAVDSGLEASPAASALPGPDGPGAASAASYGRDGGMQPSQPGLCDAGETRTCAELYGSLGDCASRGLRCIPNLGWPPELDCAPQSFEQCNRDGRDENCDGQINEAPCPTFVQLAAGERLTCGVSSSGRVECWGYTNLAPLSTSDVPIDMFGINNARHVEVDEAGNVVCVLLADGTVTCWGDPLLSGNGNPGSLGNGTEGASMLPVVVQTSTGVPLTGVRSLALGGPACALRDDGTVACWGSYLTDAPQPFATPVPGLTGVTATDVGRQHACALLSDGGVRCWVYPGWALGVESSNPDAVVSPPVAPVGLPSATALVARQDTSCALSNAGYVFCWGTGELGGESYTTDALPTAVPGLAQVVSLYGGFVSTCVQLTDGVPLCWGILPTPVTAQLGRGDPPHYTPTALEPLLPILTQGARVKQVVGGRSHQCALMDGGEVYCWGYEQAGGLDMHLLGSPPISGTPGGPRRVFGP